MMVSPQLPRWSAFPIPKALSTPGITMPLAIKTGLHAGGWEECPDSQGRAGDCPLPGGNVNSQ